MDRFNYGSFAGDASQRVHSIVSTAEAEAAGLLRDAEREAELIRREAQAEGDRIVDEARRRADDLVAERMQLLADLSDGIVERTEMLFDRIDSAAHVKRQFDDLLRNLGEAAEAVARDAGGRRPIPRSSHVPRPSGHVPRPSGHVPRPAAAPARPAAPIRSSAPPEAAPQPRREPAPAPVRRPEPVQSAPEPPRRQEDQSDARFDGARLVALQMAVAGSTREEVHSELQRAFRLADPSSILDDVFGGTRRAGAAS